MTGYAKWSDIRRSLGAPPRRVQRRRTNGWRMPEGAVYVGRLSRWGNPWRDGDLGPRVEGSAAGDREYYLDDVLAVGAFERLTVPLRLAADPGWLAPLRGRDLVCWCGSGQACHADVLLRLANQPPGTPVVVTVVVNGSADDVEAERG